MIKSAVQLGRSSIFTPLANGVLVHFPVPFKHLVETGTVRGECLVQSRTQHIMTHTTQSGSARLTIRQSRPSDTLLYATWSKVLFYNIRKGFRQGNCIFYKAFFEEFEIFATTVSKVGGVKIYNDCKMAIISVQEQSTLDFNLNSNNKENKQNNFSLLSWIEK